MEIKKLKGYNIEDAIINGKQNMIIYRSIENPNITIKFVEYDNNYRFINIANNGILNDLPSGIPCEIYTRDNELTQSIHRDNGEISSLNSPAMIFFKDDCLYNKFIINGVEMSYNEFDFKRSIINPINFEDIDIINEKIKNGLFELNKLLELKERELDILVNNNVVKPTTFKYYSE